MKLSNDDLKRLNSITDKRPSTVIQHIIKHGSITSEELETIYGYKHPPRAIRDVRERGINLETFKVKSSDGIRTIGAYRFATPIFMNNITAKASGRTVLSQTIKKALIEKFGSKCTVYNQEMDERLLQIDHRIPYEIAGEKDNESIDMYMLISPSANRAKSWTCEHCENWVKKDSCFCEECFWAHPENYTHVAGRKERHIIITFTGDEIEDYNRLIEMVGKNKAEQTIKNLLKEFIK